MMQNKSDSYWRTEHLSLKDGLYYSRRRAEDCNKFEANLGYIVSSKPTLARVRPCFKKKKNQHKIAPY